MRRSGNEVSHTYSRRHLAVIGRSGPVDRGRIPVHGASGSRGLSPCLPSVELVVPALGQLGSVVGMAGYYRNADRLVASIHSSRRHQPSDENTRMDAEDAHPALSGDRLVRCDRSMVSHTDRKSRTMAVTTDPRGNP